MKSALFGLIRILFYLSLALWLPSCTLSVQISDLDSKTLVDDTFSITLFNKPSLISNTTTLGVTVVGDNFGMYKYKVGKVENVSCGDEAGYSQGYIPSQIISDSLTGISDGEMRLCVLVSDLDSNWQSASRALEYVWTKDTTTPALPSSLTLVDPSSSPSSQSRPTFRVGGIETGASVYLYSNSSCLTLVTSGVATATSIDLRLPNDLADGTYSYYARQMDVAGNSSGCSVATLGYTMDSSLTMATISGAPTGSNATVNIDLTIGGTNIVSYRYKILSAPITIDCDNITGYSAEDVVGNHIIQNISGLPDGVIKVCVLGKESNGHWQTLGNATTASWTKAITVNNIFRSVESGRSSAIASGTSNAMSIAGTTLSFSSGVSTQIGVGDVIQYDSDNNGTLDSIAFIHGRTSSTVFTIASVNGGTPTATSAADQDWQIYRAYTSLANAESGVENTGIDAGLRDFDTWSGGQNIVTGNVQWNIALYAGADDTGNVSLAGWTTDENNILKIYTPTSASEVGISQRHIGISKTGYHLDGTISNGVQNIVIDGISINNRSLAVTVHALELTPDESEDSTIVISNSVIGQSYSPSSNYSHTIYVSTLGSAPYHSNTVVLYNNIILDAVGTGATPISAVAIFSNPASTGEDKTYLFNNTVYSLNGISLLRNAGDVDVRNNIFYSKNFASATVDWGGAGAVVSNLNNASNHAGVFSGGTNNRVSQTFSFFDESVLDFRLDTQDASVKNYGTDLSSNGVVDFNQDGLGRTRAGAWDIGAVESAIGIFRSVGPGNSSALASGGSNTLTVSSNQASFGSDLVNLDIGVGDVIQYSDGSQLRLAFITGRTSSSVFRVTDADGGLPVAAAATQTWTIYRAYTSFENALNGVENTSIDVSLRNFDDYPSDRDLKTNNFQLNVAVYADAVNAVISSGGRLSNYNTSPTNYLKIYSPHLSSEVGQGQRHKGVWSSSYSALSFNDAYGIENTNANHLRLDGLQIENATGYGVWNNWQGTKVGEVYLTNNLIRKVGAAAGSGISNDVEGAYVRVINNIVYGFNFGISFYSNLTSGDAYGANVWLIYNNTTVGNSTYGISTYSFTPSAKHVQIYNNISVNNGQDYRTSPLGGIYVRETGHNISLDSTSPDAGFRTLSPTFFNGTLRDYRLAPSDTVAKGQADSLADIAWPYTGTDIARHANHTSIGAYKAANEIYRSIGFNSTAALATGTGNTLTINSSCLVSFDNTLSNNVGVGDAIQYDSDGNASIDSILFISSRSSGTSFVAKKADGSCTSVNTVTNTSNWSIYRAYKLFADLDYLSENSGIDGNVRNFDTSGDLFANNQILNLAVYADATFTETIGLTYTTDDGNYVNMFVPSATNQVGVSQRHRGYWCSSGCTTFVRTFQYDGINGGFLSWLYSDHVYIRGIQAQLDANGHVWNTGLRMTDMPRGGFFVADSNIFDSSITGTISVGYDDNSMSKGTWAVLTNNIIKGSGAEFTGVLVSAKTNSIILNNTIYGSSSGGSCYEVSNDATTTQVLINNLAQNCPTAYMGSYSSGTGYNISNTATATGQGTDLVSQSVSFLDMANNDLRLAFAETDGVDTGFDVRNYTAWSPVLTDASGATWTTPFDIGALQKVDYSALTNFNSLGTGTAISPYELYTKAQLKDIGTNGCGTSASTACSAYFKIMQNIDLNNEAYSPIGSTANPYTGSFDGNGKTISNLNINLATTNCVGLVGDSTGSTGSIYNLTLTGVTIVGQNNVGAVLGCGAADIVNVSASNGTVTGVTYVGGAIGNSSGGTHATVYAFLTISATGGVGGGLLGGCTSCGVTSGTAQGNVSGTSNLGGVIGIASSATFSNSSGQGRVSSSTASATKIGGFVGDAAGTTSISKCTSTGDVTAANSTSRVGGFAGNMEGTATFTNVYTSSFVRGSADVGGLVGYSRGTISHATFVGRVEGDGYQVGGICGDLYTGGVIQFSSVRGTIYGGNGNSVGGISGRAYGSTIHHTIFDGDVYGSSDATGGLVGFNAGSSIYSNYTKASVIGNSAVGGILGINNSSSSDVHDNQAEGYVQAMVEEAGGIIGWDDGSGSFRNRFDGVVLAQQDAGGYAGESSAGSSGISEGVVNASVYSSTNGNAFIGNQLGADPTKSFWNTGLTALNGSSAAASGANKYEGKTNSELKSAATYGGTSAWNFTTTWGIDDGTGYPISKTMLKGECSDYKTATSYTAAGSGTSASPYLICTLAQYNDIGVSACGSSASGGCDKYFRLGADLDFRDSWPTQIGTIANIFSGVFDGQGFALKNLKTTSVATDDGLFLSVSGIIKNLKINGVSISGSTNRNRVGVLAARLTNGIIINVVTSQFSISNIGSDAGGIVGLASGGYILGSESQGTIGSGLNIGGILGKHTTIASEPLVIAQSQAYVDLTGDGGGIIGAGTHYSVSSLSKTFASGAISGTSGGGLSSGSTAIFESIASMFISSSSNNSGGIATNSMVYDSYAYGASVSAAANFGGGIGTTSTAYRSYSMNTVTGGGGGFGPTDCSQVLGADNFWDSDVAGATGCSNSVQAPKTTVEMKTAGTFTNWDLSRIWSIGATVRRPRLQWNLHPVCRSNMTAITYNAIGAGTFANPYKLCFKEQLHDLSSNGCGSSSSAACASSFVVMNDIDFENEVFSMVGSLTNQFLGTFDGGGHRISRVTINASGSDNVGFFSALQVAFVTNIIFDRVSVTGRDAVGIVSGRFWGPANSSHLSKISILNSTVTGRDYVGGVVGLLNGIQMDRLDVQATVSGNSTVGGIVGGSNNAASTHLDSAKFKGSVTGTGDIVGGIFGDCSGVVTHTDVIGTVSSSGANVGGICGYMNASTSITHSKALVDVSGSAGVGGVVGYSNSVTIENNYYRGTVTSAGANIGGFIGRSGGGTVRYNLAVPTLVGPTSAFAGLAMAGTYTNNYWDSTVSGVTSGNVAGNYEPLTTTQAQAQGNFSGWDFSEKWFILPNQYPEPR